MKKLLKPRFLGLFVGPNLGFILIGLVLSSETLIGLFNAALMALSIGVVIAYHKPTAEILFGDEIMDRADWLALGIFLSWSGGIVFRTHSIVWRALGRPNELENTIFLAYALFMMTFAAACHMAAKDALGRKRVPPERWVRIGIIAAMGVFVLILLGYALDWAGWLKQP